MVVGVPRPPTSVSASESLLSGRSRSQGNTRHPGRARVGGGPQAGGYSLRAGLHGVVCGWRVADGGSLGVAT